MYTNEKEITVQLIYQKLIRIVKNKWFYYWFPIEEKEGWHYLAVKKLSTLLRWITSKHHGGFYCLNCFHSFRTEIKTKSHEKLCKNKNVCGIIMLSEKKNIL